MKMTMALLMIKKMMILILKIAHFQRQILEIKVLFSSKLLRRMIKKRRLIQLIKKVLEKPPKD